MKFIAAASLAALFVTPAAAFDNASCKEFLTGSWSFETEQEMGGGKAHIAAQSSYNADGSFTQVMTLTPQGGAATTYPREGTWDAGPGSRPDTCLAKLHAKDEAEASIELTVIDADTVATPDGLQSKRAAQ